MGSFQTYPDAHTQPFAQVPPTSRITGLLTHLLSQQAAGDPRRMHFAAVVKRGKILAVSRNHVASRTRGASTRGSQEYIHAERRVIQMLPKARINGATMYVVRVVRVHDGDRGSHTELRYSQPCPECTVLLIKCMKAYGLKQVYFSV
jgi:deoxycytidylate deaminase